MTFSIMTLIITMICHYAEWNNAERCVIFSIMLSVIVISVVMLSVVMLSVVMLSVVKLSFVMLSVLAPNQSRFYQVFFSVLFTFLYSKYFLFSSNISNMVMII
jgi:hypothetical protein